MPKLASLIIHNQEPFSRKLIYKSNIIYCTPNIYIAQQAALWLSERSHPGNL